MTAGDSITALPARVVLGSGADRLAPERHDLRCTSWLLPDVCTCRDEHGHTPRRTDLLCGAP